MELRESVKDHTEDSNIQFTNLLNEDGEVRQHVIVIDQIKGAAFKEFKGAPLAPITPVAVLGVFLSLILATLALMCSK